MWGHVGSLMVLWFFCVMLQDLPIGLMDDIYDFITKFSTRVDEVEEVSGEERRSTLWSTAVSGILGQLHTAHCNPSCHYSYWNDRSHMLYTVHWNLSIEDTTGTQLAVLYTVEPLYRGHHWDPAGCPVYSGTSL